MIDEKLPVMLQICHEGADQLCLARLHEEAGRLYATPYQPPHSEQPYRPKLIRLDACNLALIRVAGVALPVHEYCVRLVLP